MKAQSSRELKVLQRELTWVRHLKACSPRGFSALNVAESVSVERLRARPAEQCR